jgi:pimeloyl-ACP methyl ester carboxylesterase
MSLRSAVRSALPWAITAGLAAFAVASCARWAFAQNTAPVIGGDQKVDGPAGAIYVDDGGGKEGIPVVFLHAFAGDSMHWSAQLDHLRHHRRALALDFRGHGKSAPPRDADFRVEAFEGDLAAVVDKLGIKRFVLVGHSMGGAVAIKYAGDHPGRVVGLVLVGTPGRIPPEQAKQVMDAIEADYDATMKANWDKLLAGAQPHVRTQVMADASRLPKESSLAIMRALFADDPLPSLDRYPGPKLIVYMSSANRPNDLQNARPAIPRHEFSGTSHWPHLDRPAEFNQVLDGFLATLPAT